MLVDQKPCKIGVSLSAEYTDSVAALAKKHGLKLHIDGARIFNASVDQKVTFVCHLVQFNS